MQSAIRAQSFYNVLIPKRIQNARTLRKLLLVLCLLAATSVPLLLFFAPQTIAAYSQSTIIGLLLSLGGLTVVVWLHEAILGWRMKRGSFNHMQQQTELNSIVKSMGPKTELLLKVAMCR